MGREVEPRDVRRAAGQWSGQREDNEISAPAAKPGYSHSMEEDPPRLRVLIADDDQRRIAEIADVVGGLGHTVVGRLLDVSELADAAQLDHPDVAIVAVDGHQSHALDLISAIVKQVSCPVIVDLDTDDEAFIDKAARRGIFAYVRHGEQRGPGEHDRHRSEPLRRVQPAARCAAYWRDHRAGQGDPDGTPRDQRR